MKSFYSLFQALLLLILVSNPILFFMSPTLLPGVSEINKLIIFITLTIVHFLIIMFMINKFYHKPILKLEMTIKNFLVWNLKDTKIKLEKSPNNHLNYALIFFSKTLNTLTNIKDEFIHGKEIKWEVELGKEIQWKMLTKKLIEIPSLEIIVKSRPAWEIGWDSYDIMNENWNYYIYVWDATGHWVWAWFIMIMVNALVSWFAKVYKSWATILAKTNEVLKPRVKANLLMSMLLVRWDEEEKRLFMTWAWHEYLMIYKQRQKKTYRIKSWWVALWMIKNITKLLKEQEIKFEKWDLLILYSDWITEAINKPKRDWNEIIFWEDRLEEAINTSPNMPWKNYKSARSIFNNISISLSKFMWYKHVQLDDVTLAVVHYKQDDYNKDEDFPEEIKDEFITERKW